jgi:alkylation response protein AidB-like acyl-CoA dehydrogenase
VHGEILPLETLDLDWYSYRSLIKPLSESAIRDGDQWVINGTKWMVGNASQSDFHILMARTDFAPDANPYTTMGASITA